MTTNEVGDLVADIVQLPVRPGAATRPLWMLDDTGGTVVGEVQAARELLGSFVR